MFSLAILVYYNIVDIKYFKFHILPSVITCLIGVLIPSIINYTKDRSASKIHYIDKWVNVAHQHVDKSKLEKKNVQVLFKGNPINGYSTIKVQLFNFNDKPYKNISIFVEITPQEEDSLELMEADVTGPNRIYEAIETLGDKEIKRTSKNSLKYGYRIPLANRSDTTMQPIFDADYTVLAEQKPEVEISMLSEEDDLSLTEYIQSHFDKPSFFESDAFTILAIVFGIVILIYFEIKILSHLAKRRNKRFAIYLKNNLDKKIESNLLTLNSDEIITTYRNISGNFDYEDSWAISRKIKKMKPPEELSN